MTDIAVTRDQSLISDPDTSHVPGKFDGSGSCCYFCFTWPAQLPQQRRERRRSGKWVYILDLADSLWCRFISFTEHELRFLPRCIWCRISKWRQIDRMRIYQTLLFIYNRSPSLARPIEKDTYSNMRGLGATLRFGPAYDGSPIRKM